LATSLNTIAYDLFFSGLFDEQKVQKNCIFILNIVCEVFVEIKT